MSEVSLRNSSPCASLAFPCKPGAGGRAAAILIAGLSLALGSCARHIPYVTPAITPEGTALLPAGPSAGPERAGSDAWWTALGDPAVDHLVSHALFANPTLDRAVAAIDQARAESRTAGAARLPSVAFNANGQEAQDDTPTGSGRQTTAGAGLGLAWEADLFGRVRSGAAASRHRVDARIHDAESVRLALVADVADGVVSLRACFHSVAVLEADIVSRAKVLGLAVRRRDAGMDADLDLALARTGLALARTALAQQLQDCETLSNGLVVLTGLPRGPITTALEDSPRQPAAPISPAFLPATLLKTNPLVRAAESEAAAAWSDIAVAKAERLPRIDLSAGLSGQWLKAAGTQSDGALSTIGVGLVLPIFDGGRSAAAVNASEARYRAAIANLDTALRIAARDVENALSATRSADARSVSAAEAAEAAAVTVAAREAQWRAGAVSQFEVEDARRQLATARDSEIAAQRDIALAWIALVRAAGPAIILQESPAP